MAGKYHSLCLNRSLNIKNSFLGKIGITTMRWEKKQPVLLQYSTAESHQLNLRTDDTVKTHLNGLLCKNNDISTDSIIFMGN